MEMEGAIFMNRIIVKRILLAIIITIALYLPHFFSDSNYEYPFVKVMVMIFLLLNALLDSLNSLFINRKEASQIDIISGKLFIIFFLCFILYITIGGVLPFLANARIVILAIFILSQILNLILCAYTFVTKAYPNCYIGLSSAMFLFMVYFIR